MRLKGLPKARRNSKIMGLRALSKLAPALGLKVLPFKAYRHEQLGRVPKGMEPLLGKGHDRILVRTDVRGDGHVPGYAWESLPRKEFRIGNSHGELHGHIADWAEREHKWYKNVGDLVYILHPLRPKSEYKMWGQVNRYVGDPKIYLTTDTSMGEVFRNTCAPEVVLSAGGGKLTGEFPKAANLPKELRARLLRMATAVKDHYQNDGSFELSFVTYRDRPHEPEFYDLRMTGEERRQEKCAYREGAT